MTDTYRLTLALSAIQSGRRAMLEEDGEISTDVAADFPDEAAALEHGMRSLIRDIQVASALAKATKAQAAALATRRARFEAQEQRLRGILMAAMDAMNYGTKVWPEATVTLKQGTQGVVITDEAALPAKFVKTVTQTTPMEKEIAIALRGGAEVAGATLQNGSPVLTIRNA